MPVLKRARQFLIRHLAEARDDESGIVVLTAVIAGATLAAAFATAVLNNFTGPRDQITSIQGNSGQLEIINQAIVLHAIQDSNYLLPCPASGAAGDGVAIGACNTTANNVGTVPWATLGLSEDDATDAYGKQIVYAVSAGPVGACHVLDGVPTGAVNAGTLFVGDTAPGSTALYALVSQGPNGLGAYNASGNASSPPTGTGELENCPNGIAGCTALNNFIDTGPSNDSAGSGTAFFDDEVLLASAASFTTECENFADTNKAPLEFVEEGFGGAAVSSDLVVTNNGGGGGGSSALSGGTLSVTEDVELSTASTLFTPSVTTLYNRIEWTPTAAPTNTGFSIVTRADRTTRSGSSSDYTLGISCQFFGDGIPANAQTIAIRADVANLATSGGDTYTLTIGQTYELECYDDGNNVWARITEVGNTTNQATVTTTDVSDLATPNQVIFVHSSTSGATSTLDNLLVHKGSVALELDNGGQLANTTTPLAAFASETTFTGEGWLYLRDTTASSVSMFFVEDSLSSSESRIRADVANAELEFSFVDFDTSTGSIVASSQTYGTTFWRHQAFNCDTGSDRSLYAFGSLVGSADTVACDILPGTDISNATETVSFVNNTGGRILLSEMRLWDAAQGSAAIGSNYNLRVDNAATGLDLQLRLEDAFASSTAADAHTPAENYTVTSGRFVGFKSAFRSFAEDVCPGNEDATDPFKCVYDGVGTGAATTATVDIPLDITEVLIKTWGGGGGAGANTGGGGGHAEGRFSAVGADTVSGNSLLITAAGPGQGSAGSGGGGGASAVRFSATSTTTLLIAGGGGGIGNHVSNVGGAGGGSSGQDGSGIMPNGNGGDQTNGGSGAGGGSAGGNANLTTGADGGDGAVTGGVTAAGGVGFGDGGDGFGSDTGGGGGGYAGGGGGGFGSSGGAAGGGSGYFDPTNLTGGVTDTGSGATPGDSADTDRGTAGNGSSSSGVAGNPGRVVICWSSACLP